MWDPKIMTDDQIWASHSRFHDGYASGCEYCDILRAKCIYAFEYEDYVIDTLELIYKRNPQSPPNSLELSREFVKAKGNSSLEQRERDMVVRLFEKNRKHHSINHVTRTSSFCTFCKYEAHEKSRRVSEPTPPPPQYQSYQPRWISPSSYTSPSHPPFTSYTPRSSPYTSYIPSPSAYPSYTYPLYYTLLSPQSHISYTSSPYTSPTPSSSYTLHTPSLPAYPPYTPSPLAYPSSSFT